MMNILNILRIQIILLYIIINNLLEKKIYSELKQEPENEYLSGFIYIIKIIMIQFLNLEH